MKNQLFATTVATPAILFSTLLLGTQNVSADSVKVTDEGGLQLSITANRREQPLDQTLASVTVITRSQIENSPASSITNILSRYVEGIDLTTSGGRGKNISLFLRGGSSKQVLVLIDGVRAGSVSAGTMAWQHLSSDMIESIEIVRGPRSSLYGSEAMSGIISITTRKGKKGKWHGSASVGSNHTKSISLGTTIGSDQTSLSVNTSLLDTNGFDARNGGNTDDDGYNNKSINLKFDHKFNDKTSLAINVLQAKGVNEYDGFGSNSGYPDYTPTDSDGVDTRGDFLQQNFGVNLKTAFSKKWKSEFLVGQFKDESVNYNSQVSLADGTVNTTKSTIDTKRQQFDWKNEISLRNNKTLVLGVDHQKDKATKSGDDYTKNSRNNTGMYGELSGSAGVYDYQISLRTDDNQTFGRFNTGSLSLSKKIGNSRLTASYGTAFKAPTLNELYWPSTPFFVGNPDLQPEESKTFEVGLKTKLGKGRFNASIFQSKISNLLAYQFPTTANIKNAEIDGLELGYSRNIGALNLNTNVTLLNPRDTDSGEVLAKRAKQTLKINLDRDFGRFSMGASLLGKSKRAASFGSGLAGYGVVDLRSSYKITKNVELQLDVNNVLDKEYKTTSGYDTDGRNFMISVSYK